MECPSDNLINKGLLPPCSPPGLDQTDAVQSAGKQVRPELAPFDPKSKNGDACHCSGALGCWYLATIVFDRCLEMFCILLLFKSRSSQPLKVDDEIVYFRSTKALTTVRRCGVKKFLCPAPRAYRPGPDWLAPGLLLRVLG